jgi:hypothetical protein
MDNALLCIPYNQTNIQKLFEKKNVKAEKKQTLQREKVLYYYKRYLCGPSCLRSFKLFRYYDIHNTEKIEDMQSSERETDERAIQ